MKRKKILALALVVMTVFSFMLTGCGSKGAKMDKEQFLNLSMVTPKTFDAQKANDANSTQIITMIMDGLTRVANDGTGDRIEPALAESWDTSKDGLIWTFNLRDAKWSDGQPVTAQQFVDAWMRLLNPEEGFDYASYLFDIKGAEEYNGGSGKAEDVAIKAIGDKKLEVTLKHPLPYFIQLTPFKNLYPVRLDVVDKLGEKYGTDPTQMIFNGPFAIKEYSKGTKIVFEKNPTYWDEKKVKLQAINMTWIEEEATRNQMFQAKQIDLTTARGDYAIKYTDMAKNGQLSMVNGYDATIYYVIFNCQTGGTNKLFLNPKVRLAFSLAIDRDDYVNNITKKGYVAYGLVPPTILVGNTEFRKEAGDPFKELINKYPDPKAVLQDGLKELGMDPASQLTIKFLDRGTSSTDKIFQEWFKSQWEQKLGVKIDLDVCADSPQYWDKVDAMEYDICTYGWGGDYNDPDTFLNLFTTGNSNNPARWTSKDYDDLYAKTKATADNKERMELFSQMEDMLIDNCAIAPLNYAEKKNFSHPYVKNVMYSMFGPTEYKYAYTEGRQ